MESLVTDRPETTDLPMVNVETDTLTFGVFLLRAFIAAVLIGLSVLAALVGAKTFDVFPAPTNGSITPPASTSGPSAGIESTMNYKWSQILGPNGTKMYTQCSSIEPGQRVYMTSTGSLLFRSDSNCK